MVRHTTTSAMFSHLLATVLKTTNMLMKVISHCTVTRLPLINYKQSVSSKIFSLIIKCIYINKKYNSPTNNVKNKDVCVRQMIS